MKIVSFFIFFINIDHYNEKISKKILLDKKTYPIILIGIAFSIVLFVLILFSLFWTISSYFLIYIVII